jgi:hypothetical protein
MSSALVGGHRIINSREISSQDRVSDFARLEKAANSSERVLRKNPKIRFVLMLPTKPIDLVSDRK